VLATPGFKKAREAKMRWPLTSLVRHRVDSGACPFTLVASVSAGGASTGEADARVGSIDLQGFSVKTRHLIAAAAGLIVVVGILFSAGIVIGSHSNSVENSPTSGDFTRRDFMFQVVGVKTPNQGGHTINLFFHYRYNSGITNNEIPDYTKLRRQAIDYLDAVDVSANPYWEVLNNHLCAHLKSSYPIEAISCLMQVVGSENPLPHDEPGYRSSIETIGDIAPLVLPGPGTA
jgi:hypothetical protein